MNKTYLKWTVLTALFLIGLQAKAVITVSFTSASALDSVKVENLTRGTSTMLKSSFSVDLENLTAGIQNPNANTANGTSNTVVYPNPFSNQVNVEYYATTAQKVYVSVYDIAGRVVSEYNQQMEQGVHKLHFKPNNAGLYLIKVADKTGSSASKVYCLQSSSSSSKLEYEGKLTANIAPSRVKSSTEADTPNPGDMLRFTGYSAGKTTTQYDVARVSKSYTLTFASAYNVKNYSVSASKPCLVDIMFAVMDANNKGVDYLSNTDFTVSEDGATTSPSETFRYVSKMQQLPSTIKTVLLLDNSLSIGADLATIKAAAIKFVQSMYGKQQVAIYSFSDAPVLLQDFTADKTLLQNAINGITLGFPSTNLYGSAVTALSKWTDTYALTGILQGSLVLFTDGSDTQGSSTLSAVTTARGDKKIYVIGLGAEITSSALNSIANPGPYYPIANVSELDAVFATIQSDIAQYANSFYWLNYMTPKRTGSHTLKLEVKNNLNSNSTSSFSSSFSATGFTSILSGVCINKDDNHLSGLDTIRCYSSATGYHFYEKTATTLLSNDSLQLNPTTYWAIKPPVFTWSITKQITSKLLPTPYSTATIYPLVTGCDTTVINLQDKANAYTRNAVLVVGTELPTLTTATPKTVTATTATLGGEVTYTGRGAVTARGICYATSSNPTIANSKVVIGSGKGIYETTVTGLLSSQTYYARAYATNAAGTIYGNEVIFTTLPTVTTTAISAITATTASSGGNVTSTGTATVTARGVCWSTTPNPTTTDNKTTDGTSTGVFTSSITGLASGTTYYVRTYSTNAGGTNYGTEVSFTTLCAATTASVSSITATTATCGGEAISAGGSAVTARGVCWSTTANPTTVNSKTTDGTGTVTFISSLTGLVNGTTYYVRSYVTNSTGTNYGNQVTFTTLSSVTTTAISAITATTATSGGNVTSTGGAPVTACGVCWSTTPNPTTTDNKTTDGTSTGVFTSLLTGLASGTTYYIRAYTTNAGGTNYGTEVSFTTLCTVNTANVSTITATTATCGGEAISAGGSDVIARGVCWSTTANPTTANSKTTDGAGTGTFISSLTGLIAGTTYYVKSYATNSVGTSYGNEISFTATSVIPTVTTIAFSAITATTATSGGNVTSTGGLAVTARGVCWSTVPSPTIADSKTSDGTGIGTFTTVITGLVEGTTYYVRAYATNSLGTAYGAEVSLTTFGTITYDGFTYNTVVIGTQTWMVENLKTTHYRDGTLIPNITADATWKGLTTGAWCDYGKMSSKGDKYGHLYNWYAVSDIRNIAPEGWHVPTDAEWTTLTTYLGGIDIAGEKLKESGTINWMSPNTGATNESNFSALPGGSRYGSYDYSAFNHVGYGGYWWSSTEINTSTAGSWYLYNDMSKMVCYNYSKFSGFSVRCVRDF